MKHRNTLTAVSALALLLALGGAANAADMYSGSSLKDIVSSSGANTWGGFTLGANAGFGWGNGTNLDSGNGTTVTGISDETKPEGLFAGLEGQYTIQIGSSLVGGVATDIYISDINDTSVVTLGGTDVGDRQSRVDWFGTTRAILGVPVGNLLPYATAGLAYGGVSDQATSDAFQARLEKDGVRFGWVAGGGLMMQMSDKWSLDLKYLHVDLGSDSLGGLVNGTPISTNKVDNAFDAVLFGVKYKTNFTN